MQNKSDGRNPFFMTFILENESFAVSVRNVIEVVEKQRIVPLPDSPSEIIGMINFRGEIVPVMDSCSKLLIDRDNKPEKNMIIVMELNHEIDIERQIIAVKVDRVKDVIKIEQEQMLPVPETKNGMDTSLLSGMAKINELFIMIVDADNAFKYESG